MDQAIKKKEMEEAVLRSGYLLEQRIESILSRNGYYVTPNAAYLDPYTGKSREIDIEAITAEQITKESEFLYQILLCECENNRQPLVFFLQDNLVTSINYFEAKVIGMPIKILDESSREKDPMYYGLIDFFQFNKYHHYRKGNISTQYCSFNKKNSNSPWIASHLEEQHNTLNNLVIATESRIDDFYRLWKPPMKGEKEFIDITIYYPVLILQGEMYGYEHKSGRNNFKKLNHIQYRKEFVLSDKKQKTYQIDVVTEKYFPEYIKLVNREVKKANSKIKSKKKILRKSIDSIVGECRIKGKQDSYREILEF